MTLSDLDLVNQAMAAEAAYVPPTNGANTTNPSSTPTPAPSNNSTSNTNNSTTNPPASDPLADIDLSTLSPADRAALQPILDALKAASGDEGDLDVEDILNQLEAAGDAADVLEGRLDALLAHLGELEADVTPSETPAEAK